MKCSRVRALLSKYVDSELGEAGSARVREHLQGCPACRAEEAELRRVSQLLGEWPGIEPKLGFDTLLARLDQRRGARRRMIAMPALPVPKWAAAAMAGASMAAGLALGLVVSEDTGPSGPPSEQQLAIAMDLHPYDEVEVSLAYSLNSGSQSPAEKGEPR